MLTHTQSTSDGTIVVEETNYGSDVHVVALAGELDLAVINVVRAALEPALADPPGMVVIDLTELEFLDASGVALFFRLCQTCPRPDSLRLLSSRHQAVNRILELTKVGEIMTIVAS
jgi:anti-sigma B factor antagonist